MLFNDLLFLFFPEVCAACHQALMKGERSVCMSCRYHLPKTDFHKNPENPMAKNFWGRIPLETAVACYYFNKGEKVQSMLHALKYKGLEELGREIGKLYGQELKDSNSLRPVDLVCPVPLHPKKLRKRGYNQSASFAEGIASGLGTEYSYQVLKRQINTSTQTRKNKTARWQNVKDVFCLDSKTEAGTLQNKHILIVDDVVTTGATLEAAAKTLLSIQDTKISLAAMAYAT
jgi:ComF family protein